MIETVITPKEGCKLVVRSSKSTGQEEYFVDAVEVVSFGNSLFLRSTERPKTFLVPATDYEVLEVREARMVLKNVGLDRTIKIAGGREAQMRTPREQVEKQPVEQEQSFDTTAEAGEGNAPQGTPEKSSEQRSDKKRDRRRQNRRRRGREGAGAEDESAEGEKAPKGENGETNGTGERPAQVQVNPPVFTALLPPPPTLISETIARYKDNALFKDAFYSKEEPASQDTATSPKIELQPPEYGSFEVTAEQEEEIYLQRKKQNAHEKEENHHEVHPHTHYEGTFSEGDLDAPHHVNNEKEDI